MPTMPNQLPADLEAHRSRLADHLAELVCLAPAAQRDKALEIAMAVSSDADAVMVSTMRFSFRAGLDIRRFVLEVRDWWQRWRGRS